MLLTYGGYDRDFSNLVIMNNPSRNASPSATYHFYHLLTITTTTTNTAYATNNDATDDDATTVKNYDEYY
jgi:hypothetical protein